MNKLKPTLSSKTKTTTKSKIKIKSEATAVIVEPKRVPKVKHAKKITLPELVKKIRTAESILLATHQNPDGDGLGSILALGMGLKQLGKKVYWHNIDGVPRMYRFLPGQNLIKQTIPQSRHFDLSFIVDLGEQERCGPAFLAHSHKGQVISLDHHAKGVHNCDYDYCLPKQASSGEVIFKVMKALKIKLNKAMATNIYTAMVTDTGSFKYSNTNAETFAIAAELAEQKIDVWQVAQHCFETYTPARMALLQRTMASMQVHEGGKLAWIVLRDEDFAATGALPEDSEGFINFPRSIESVEVAVCFKQQQGGPWRISLRSKNYFDVAAVAQKFSGGGHIRAAGCRLEGDLSHVQKRLFAELLPRL